MLVKKLAVLSESLLNQIILFIMTRLIADFRLFHLVLTKSFSRTYDRESFC